MKPKRSKISLTAKIDILDSLKRGEKVVNVAKKRNLNESTVRSIRKNEKVIRNVVSIAGNAPNSYYAKDLLRVKTEKKLAMWIQDNAQKGIDIDTRTLKKKAQQFYKTFENEEPSTSTDSKQPEFNASNGWLQGFLSRHSLHDISLKGEGGDFTDTEAAKEFTETFLKTVEYGGYVPDQVFNAAETKLYWKRMPRRTYISKHEKSLMGYKTSRDRVTLFLCSNASGDNILKPLLVNKSHKPRALKGINIDELPVCWTANTNALMNESLFKEWFEKSFVPEVQDYLYDRNLDFKVLLLIDKSLDHAIIEHPNIKFMFFPTNTTCFLQPHKQGIFSIFKSYYIKHSFQYIIDQREKNNELTAMSAWKKFDLKNSIIIISSVLNNIESSTINKCWKNLWKDAVSPGEFKDNSEYVRSDICELANIIGGEGFSDMNENDILELLGNCPTEDDENLQASQTNDKDFEEENEVCVTTSLTAKLIQEGLEKAAGLQKHFKHNDPNGERAARFQQKIKDAIQCYSEEAAFESTLTPNSIRQGLEIADELENFFLLSDPNEERVVNFQRKLKDAIKCYQDLYDTLKD